MLQLCKLAGLVAFLLSIGGSFLDHFFSPAGFANSALHRLDPRVKTVSILCFIALVSSLTTWTALLFGALFLAGLGALAGLNPFYFGRRLLWILPFAGILIAVLPFAVPGEMLAGFKIGAVTVNVSKAGAEQAVILFLRMMNAVFALSLLTATTGFRGLMRAFRELRVPLVFVQLIEFTVRYIFVLIEETQRMMLARRARAFRTGKSLLDKRTFLALGQLLGVLFLRSGERGERIYLAMLSRGLGNQSVKKELVWPRTRDLGWGLCIPTFALALRMLETGGVLWQTLLK